MESKTDCMTQKIKLCEDKKKAKSKDQKKYEQLLKEITKKKKQHENLVSGLQVAIPRVIAELKPLAVEENEWHLKKLLRLDEIVDEIVISKAKKEIFIAYILQETITLLSAGNSEKETLKFLFEKYAKEPFEQEEESDFEENMDEWFSDDDFDQEQKFNNPDFKEKKQKKTVNKKVEDEEKLMAQDAKSIYFQLIKKYHPDRQKDTQKQLEFTEITKLVTKAYKENDFMGLLRLQIEYIDENEIDAVADDILKRYNKALADQLYELKLAISVARMESFGIVEDFFDEDNTFSEFKFQTKKKELLNNISFIKSSIDESYKQKKGWFKVWLKELQELNEMKDLMYHFTGYR